MMRTVLHIAGWVLAGPGFFGVVTGVAIMLGGVVGVGVTQLRERPDEPPRNVHYRAAEDACLFGAIMAFVGVGTLLAGAFVYSLGGEL